MRLAVEAVLPAPPERVWTVLLDWERQADWMKDADSVRVISAHREGVGVRVAVRTRLFNVPLFTEVLEVVAWEPPRYLLMAHGGLVRGTGKWALQADPGGTRFTWTEEIALAVPLVGGVAAQLYGPFLRRLMTGGVRRLREVVLGGP